MITSPILHRALSDMNLAIHRQQQELLGIEFFQFFPLVHLRSYQVESVLMAYDILYHNSQDGTDKNMERCLIIPKFLLAFFFSLRCF